MTRPPISPPRDREVPEPTTALRPLPFGKRPQGRRNCQFAPGLPERFPAQKVLRPQISQV